jgi:phage anti-repressor protein
VKRDQKDNSCQVEFSTAKCDKRSNKKWNEGRDNVICWEFGKEVVYKNPQERGKEAEEVEVKHEKDLISKY